MDAIFVRAGCLLRQFACSCTISQTIVLNPVVAMALDFRQVQKQVRQMGETASLRERQLGQKRDLAHKLLAKKERDLQRLREKVQRVAREYDPGLRCALPVSETLDFCASAPPLSSQATILAADGSQIAPDRHAEVNYCLINVGAVQMRMGSSKAPEITIDSQLFYDDDLYSSSGTLTEGTLALMRDASEREMLAKQAREAAPPVISFTDGPMELWGAKDGAGATEFKERLDAYKQALQQLSELQVATAGYIDKPAANLVVRLLEISMLSEQDLSEIKQLYPLRGVTDFSLYRRILGPGERSGVFAIQSQSAANYAGELALHFFYLNVGREARPWIARVELPAWVMNDPHMLDNLHAALVEQSRIMGARPYPYVLHRAHEAAVVTWQEKEQVTQMIVMELRRRGVTVGEQSAKQAAKSLPGKTSYKGSRA
jgi:hypothetical protein